MAFSAWRLRLGLIAAVAVMATTNAQPARAQIGSDRYAAIVTEARSGAVLMAANADEQRYPASLTKVMTVYMALEGLRDGRFQRWTPIVVSANAARMPPSRLGLTAGMTLTVEEAILALVTKSANDAAAALGEFLGGGSEQRFAQMMTMRARQLGMTRTTFRNASGLPDLDQVSTARDMATLGKRLIQDFPREYSYFSTPHFVFRGRTHWNHNRLLQEYDGTDGIKTGYVNDSGFNLLASTQREGVRLIAAVFGGRTGRERDRHMMAILDQGFLRVGINPREPVAVASARSMPRVISSARAATPQARPVATATSRRAPAAVAARRPAASRPGTATAQRAGTPAVRNAMATRPRGAPAATPQLASSTRKGRPAQAAAAPSRPAAATPAARGTPAKQATTVRTAASTGRPGTARIEQGDTSRSVAATRTASTSRTR